MNNYNVNYNDMTIFEKFMQLPLSMYVFMLAIPLIVGLLVVFLLVRYAGGKKTTDFRTYAPTGGQILASRDRFTHQTETRTRIKQNNGGGSHGSHGGHSRGGGGHRGGGHRGGGHRGGGGRGGRGR